MIISFVIGAKTAVHMKKIITLLFFIALFANKLKAQDEVVDTPSSVVVKLHPQQFIDKTFFLSLEKFNKKFENSFSIGLGLTSSNNYVNESGYKAEFQYRYFPLKFAEKKRQNSKSPYFGGIYAGIFLNHSYNVGESKYFSYNGGPDPVEITNKHTVTAFNPGVLIGYQQTIFEILYIEAFVGGGIRTASIADTNPDEFYYNNGIFDEDYRGVFPKIGFSIGLGL